MSNGKISFEVEGVNHSLYFGMAATQIISEKSIQAVDNGEVDNIKAFAYIVYAGLCNNADRKDLSRPGFDVAYDIAEAIAGNHELTAEIYKTWSESKPSVDLMEKLNGVKKKAEAKKSLKKTGTK